MCQCVTADHRGGGDRVTVGTLWGEVRGFGSERGIRRQAGAAAAGRGARVHRRSARGGWFGSLSISHSMFSIHEQEHFLGVPASDRT